MTTPRRFYYDLFSRFYDLIIRLHSGDQASSLRTFIATRTHLAPGDKALDLCTGTGSVAVALSKQVGEKGLIVGLDFSRGMVQKAKDKALTSSLNQLHLVQGDASHLPFKSSSFHGVTCSHAFYELKGSERKGAIDEVARVLVEGGRFCLMEHATPQRPLLRLLFHIRILFLGSKDVMTFLAHEESIFGDKFNRITTAMSPTGKSKLISGVRGRLESENP
jgi:demethylmenaquinone methyltransferase/2-methoxy-6-polyprenyl-1,4-benzoquinol methylase